MDTVRIQTVGRLVEDQQPRPSEHGLGKGQALAHAHRVALHLVVCPLGHPYRAEELGDLLLVDRAQGAREKPQVLAAGKEAVQRRLLERRPEEASRSRVGGPAVLASDPGRAAVGVQQPQQDADGRGLAGAVRAQEPENLALGDAERDLVHGAHASEALGEPFDLD